MIELENTAHSYVSQSSAGLVFIGSLILIVGASIAPIFRIYNYKLSRAPYFVYLSAILLISTVMKVVWLLSVQAALAGFLWVLVLVDVLVLLVTGYALAVIAMARSRDAYGHAGMAFLAFIPIANFWLLFRSSKENTLVSYCHVSLLFVGARGVFLGIIILIGAVAFKMFLEYKINEKMIAAAEDYPQTEEPVFGTTLEMMLQHQGLEATIRQIAFEVPSRRISDVMVLRRAEGDGNTLRYIYDLSIDIDMLPAEFHESVAQQNCAFQDLLPIINAGATLEHAIHHVDGPLIDRIVVTKQTCEFWNLD